jgi:hypothetical protein
MYVFFKKDLSANTVVLYHFLSCLWYIMDASGSLTNAPTQHLGVQVNSICSGATVITKELQRISKRLIGIQILPPFSLQWVLWRWEGPLKGPYESAHLSEASHLINLYLETKALPQSVCMHLNGRSLEWE